MSPALGWRDTGFHARAERAAREQPAVPVSHPFGEPAPFAIRVPGGVIELNGNGVTVVRYPGLPPFEACAIDDAYYAAKAGALGYGRDLDGFVRDHELLHHLTARWLALPHSPTLHGSARGVRRPRHGLLEEAAVEACHAYARAMRVDLVRLAVEAGEKG